MATTKISRDEAQALYDEPWQAARQVPTGDLRPGDLIALHGCLMEVQQMHSRADEVNEGRHGLCRWTRARVLHIDGTDIPPHWFDRDAEGFQTWTVQGNDLATWQRIRAAAERAA